MRAGWTKVRLGELMVRTTDRLGNSGEPVVLTCTENYGLVDQMEHMGRRLATADVSKYKLVRPYDVVYNVYLLWLGAIGQNLTGSDGITSPVYEVFRPTDAVFAPYLGHLLRSPEMVERYAAISIGTVPRRRRAPWESVLDITVDLPPLAEQRRVVDLIGSLDEAIEGAADAAAQMESLSDSLASREFVRMIAEHGTVALSEMATTRLGKMLSASVASGSEPAPYLRNADVQWDAINLENLKKMPFSDADRLEYSLRSGDVLICEGGIIGRSAVLESDLDGVYFQKAIHRVRCGDSLRPEMLQRYMRHLATTGGLDDFASGSTIRHLTGEKLRQIPVPAAPLQEQDDLIAITAAVTGMGDAAADYADSLRSLRANLLTALLSGEHEIPESYDTMLEMESAT